MIEKIKVKGMNCRSCEKTISQSLEKLTGIDKVDVVFNNNIVKIKYDKDLITIEKIKDELIKMGYEINDKNNFFFEISFILLICLIVYFLNSYINAPSIEVGTGYGMLFIIGLTTSFHCIFMCGGINLAATANKGYRGGFHYNLGRVLSYTLIGGIIGLVGSVISVNQTTRDLINIFVGTIMFLMGLQMLRIINLPKIFKKPSAFRRAKTPFLIGVVNGFMPCGPLQSMQLYALSTGSFIAGALSMTAFSLGTVPLMMGLSFFGTLTIGKNAKLFKKTGALIILAFGLLTVLRSVELPTIVKEQIPPTAVYAIDMGEYQEINVRFERGKYVPIVVVKNKKVVWNITIENGDLNTCNNEIQMEELQINHKLKMGANQITFHPKKKGVYKYTCWMNMLYNKIYVVDKLPIE